uniref:NADH-ubiquinone oxidoreductase chain 5 n=1 Tax=Sminthurides bifidus TaxID=2584528 RepID=A0A6H0EXM7_9HEXA|nr:NADH dehydrogenase subunit 5 [Sminthurides bifidus]
MNKLGFFLSSFLFSVCCIMFPFSLYLYHLEKVIFVEFDIAGVMNSVSFSYLILFDWMSSLFIAVVSLISLIVFIYSTSYMSADPQQPKFLILVFMFVVSMYLMIISPNLMSILLGWDGLGLVSYGLVIYYQSWKSFNSGMITLLSNRVGDLAILVSICWAINFGSVSVYDFQNYFSSSIMMGVLAFTCVLAAMTKSAQIPFSAWLPAAMAAPTPVSSLVHSSTLVTAGVYLLVRFNFLCYFNYYLMLISMLTMVMSGVSALFETDLKKIIALSTLSQLAVMMFILSLGSTELSFFHLVTHALFKSLLFLCAGFYIHSNFNWQDSRLFVNSMRTFPVFSTYFSIASLALSGFPFLAGFYSKDLIIEYFFSSGSTSLPLFCLLVVATGLTLVYSLRLIILIFMFSSKKVVWVSQEDWTMAAPMGILFLASITAGSGLSWLILPGFFIPIPQYVKMLVIVLLSLIYLFMMGFYKISMGYRYSWFLGLMWGLPSISSNLMIYLMNKSIYYIKLVDQGWLEIMGGQGLSTLGSKLSMHLDKSNLVNVKLILSGLFIFILTISVLL